MAVAALARARVESCTSVTLNATGDGEPVYRKVGFRSLGLGMTWWLFPRNPRRPADCVRLVLCTPL